MVDDLIQILPLLGVVIFALGLLFYELIAKADSVWWVGIACLSGVAFYLVQLVQSQLLGGGHLGEMLFKGSLFSDSFSGIFGVIILCGTLLSSLLHHRLLKAQNVEESADVDLLLLLTAAGGLIMVAAANLLVFFVAFELLSVSVYALTGLARKEAASAEASLKYFLLGAFSSAFMIYGITLIYGATGTIILPEIAGRLSSSNPILLMGLGLLIFGFCFKVSLVPFHFWAPDVYQGAPVSISGFMAAVVKTAAFGAFLRVIWKGFLPINEVWSGLIWTLAALSMCVGNLLALKQTSIKRMLAYSSVAHAGYIAMGFLALEKGSALQAVSFYLLVYTLMTIVAFGVVLLVSVSSGKQYSADNINSFKGLGWKQPVLAFVMLLALLSLGGMPPLGGFIAKFYLFQTVLQAGYPGLVILAALNSVVSLFYYLRLVVLMYFEADSAETEGAATVEVPLSSAIALGFSAVGIVYLGLFSDGIFGFLKSAMQFWQS